MGLFNITKESYNELGSVRALRLLEKSSRSLKKILLISVLVISVLLNAAGIVFFILFLTEHGHYKSARKEKAQLERSLAVVQSAGMINQINQSNPGDPVQKHNFVSKVDGLIDTYAFQEPQFSPGALDYVLLVYLHGMGSTQMEPFVVPPGQSIAATLTRENPRVGFLSLSCRREAAWGNDQAIEDICQNIREVYQKYPFKSIVMMGTSMGGCVSLNFAAVAPPDIKEKITGAICVLGAGDLTDLFNKTDTGAVKQAMMSAFGGAPDQVGHIYQKKSFLSNIDLLSHSTRVAVISARDDKVVPPELQKAIVDALTKRGIPNHLDEVDGSHEAPPVQFYSRAFKFTQGDNLQQ